MAFFQRAVTLSLFALAVSAAPASGSKSELTIEDIINAPYNPPPLADPAFAPIVAASNETFVEGNPAAQSKVDNVASVLASITAAASTATLSVETPAPTTITNKPKLRRAGGPTSPPPTPDYDLTECANFFPVFAPGISPAPPTLAATRNLWNTLARKVCHDWFGNPADTFPYNGPNSSPAVYVVEDSCQAHGSIPPNPIQGFQFEYAVRDGLTPFWEYYATSQDLCTAELEARIGWMFSNCYPIFGDVSGFSSYNDPNSVIVYKAWKLPNDPSGFDKSQCLP